MARVLLVIQPRASATSGGRDGERRRANPGEDGSDVLEDALRTAGLPGHRRPRGAARLDDRAPERALAPDARVGRRPRGVEAGTIAPAHQPFAFHRSLSEAPMSVVAVAGSLLAVRSVRRRGGRRYRFAVHVATAWAALVALLLSSPAVAASAWAALVALLLLTLPAVASLFGSQQIDRAGVLQSSPLARLDLSATARLAPSSWQGPAGGSGKSPWQGPPARNALDRRTTGRSRSSSSPDCVARHRPGHRIAPAPADPTPARRERDSTAAALIRIVGIFSRPGRGRNARPLRLAGAAAGEIPMRLNEFPRATDTSRSGTRVALHHHRQRRCRRGRRPWG